MLIDIYIAGIEKSEHKNEWNAFSRFLKTYPAQKILAENGYRPVNKKALTEFRSKFPVRPGETKITSPLLGGWRAVDKKWFDPNKSIMQKIEAVARGVHWLAFGHSRRRDFRRPPRIAGRGPRRLSPCRWASSRRSCSFIVVLPIAAVVWKSTGNGWSGSGRSSPRRRPSRR